MSEHIRSKRSGRPMPGKFFVWLMIVGFGLSMVAGDASAYSRLPDITGTDIYNDPSGPVTHNVSPYLALSRSGTAGNTLDADNVSELFVFDGSMAGQQAVIHLEGENLPGGTWGRYGTYWTPDSVYYRIFAYNPGAANPYASTDISAGTLSSWVPASSTGGSITITLPAALPAGSPGAGKVIVAMSFGQYLTCAPGHPPAQPCFYAGNFFGYRVWAGNTSSSVLADVSYARDNQAAQPDSVAAKPPNGGYAVKDRYCAEHGQSANSVCLGSESEFVNRFAVPCQALPVGSSSDYYIKWIDADRYGGLPDNSDIDFIVRATDQLGNSSIILSADDALNYGNYPDGVTSRPAAPNNVGTNIGGNQEYRAMQFTARGGYKYDWIWQNVKESNGVQFWNPFDSFLYTQSCAAIDAAVCSRTAIPSTLIVNSAYPVTITMQNTATTGTWLVPAPYNVTFSATAGSSSLAAPSTASVPAGSSVSWNGSITAPATAGTATYTWQMAKNGVAFGTACSATVTIIAPWQYQIGESNNNGGFPGYSVKGSVLDISSGTANDLAVPVQIDLYAFPVASAVTADNYTVRAYLNDPGGHVTLAGTNPPSGGAWAGAGLAPNTHAYYNALYTVNPTTPTGYIFCVYASVTPGSSSSAAELFTTSAPFTLCYQVINPRYPYLSTTQGDIHSGGTGASATCNLPGVGGVGVVGLNKAGLGSIASYVITAATGISQFGSHGAVGNTSLAAASYGSLCRPDVAANAESYITQFGPSIDAAATGTLNPAYVPTTLASRLIKHNGPVHITAGTVTGRYTLYVQGDVYIDGDLSYTAAPRPLDDFPSLGIIATGNIYIKPTVRNVVGALYAVGDIYTCTPYDKAACDANPLRLNGSMYAHNFSFQRTYGGIFAGHDTGVQAAEQVDASPRLYIAPPPGFADLASVQSGGAPVTEKPPLY